MCYGDLNPSGVDEIYRKKREAANREERPHTLKEVIAEDVVDQAARQKVEGV